MPAGARSYDRMPVRWSPTESVSMRRAWSNKASPEVSPPPRQQGYTNMPSAGHLHLPKELFDAPAKERPSPRTEMEEEGNGDVSAMSTRSIKDSHLMSSPTGDADADFKRVLQRIEQEHMRVVARRVRQATCTLIVENTELRRRMHAASRHSLSERGSEYQPPSDIVMGSTDERERDDRAITFAEDEETCGQSEGVSDAKTVAGDLKDAKVMPGLVPGQLVTAGLQDPCDAMTKTVSGIKTPVSGTEASVEVAIQRRELFTPWPVWNVGAARMNRKSTVGSEIGAISAHNYRRSTSHCSLGSHGSETAGSEISDRDDARQGMVMRMKTERTRGRCAGLIWQPHSTKRLTWDGIGSLLIVYDMIMIPLRAFDIPASTFTIFMDWLTLVFWTLNMATSTLMAYTEKGVVIMVPRKIIWHYARGWLLVDLIVLVPDWVFAVAAIATSDDSDESSSSPTKLIRALRIFRTIRLVRLLKLRWILVKINEAIDSEYVSIVANILKMILVLLAINHFIACCWFWLASVQDSSWGRHQNWVDYHDMKGESWGFQYATSFHWSLTQFTPASMEVQPQNVLERAFAVTVVVFALVGFSYLVGSITGSLSQLRSMREESAQQFWNVRRFLRQHTVPQGLQLRIQKYLEHAWQRKVQNSNIKSIPMFSLLSEQLRNELLCAINVPPMRVHPLFDHLHRFSYVTMQRLATTAISRKQLARRDTLFFPGEQATHMYFPVGGRFRYQRLYGENGSGGLPPPEWVDKFEDWISEPVLYTSSWVHLGTLMAAEEADLLLIETAAFSSAIKLNPHAFRTVQGYAEMFLEWINSTDPSELSDIAQGEDVSTRMQSFIPAVV